MTDNIEQVETPVEDITFEKDPLSFGDSFSDLSIATSLIPTGHSDSYLKRKAQEMSLINRAVHQGLSADDSYSDSEQVISLSPDVLTSMNAKQKLFAQQTTDEVRNIITRDVATDPSMYSRYKGTLDNLDVIEQQYEGLLGQQKLLADVYSNESPISRFNREEVTRNYAASLFEEWAEGRGVLDKIVDVGGLIIDPMSFTLDANELVTSIDPELGGDAIENFTKVVAGYQVADPEIKQQLLPDLLKKATEAYDNNEFKVGAFVGLLNDPNFFTESYVTGGLESVEAGTLLATAPLSFAYKTAKSVHKSTSLRQRLKRMGNKKEAVDTTRTPDRSQVDEAMDADATNWEKTYMGTNATDELSPQYQSITDSIKDEVVQPINKAFEDAKAFKVDALTDAEKEVAKSNYIDALNSKSEGGINSAEIVKDTKDGFLVNYQVSTKGSNPVVRQEEVLWTVDDAGSLVASNEKHSKLTSSWLGTKLLSPDTYLRSIDDSIVKDVTYGGLQSSVLRNQMNTIWKGTDKGLSKQSRQAVDELLIAGDEAGEVFSVGDLRAGTVQTVSGKRKYTMQEIQAYSAKRAFLDESHKLQNYITRRKLEFQGFKETRWVNPATGIEEVRVAKPFKNGQGFTTDVTEDIIAPGLAGDKISLTKRGAIDVKKAIEDGFTPVKFESPIKIDNKTIKYGLIRNTEGSTINDLPAQVLNKTTGYVPRISKPGYYYVKDSSDGLRTVSRHKTKEDAERYIEEIMSQQELDNVPANQRVKLQALRDRDMSSLEAISEDANTWGGLYTGARNKTGIFEGDELANEVTRLSTGQSIQRMLDAVSTQMPLNEYRIAVSNKWKESVRSALKENGFDGTEPIFRQLSDPQEWKDLKLPTSLDNNLRVGLEAHRDYMINSLRIPTNQENIWSDFMMNIADSLPNSKVRDMTVSLASKNPIQSLKGATFDAYLGWFNPRQLWVQTQNAALAVSMHPVRGLPAVKDSFVQRIFLYTPDIDSEMLKKAAKGIDIDDIDDTIASLEQFKRSGLRDGVMRTGDYNANLGGFSSGSLEGFRKLAAKGRVFFEEGESMARLISWNVARRGWKELNPGKTIDAKAIREIADDTLRMNMNMQRENAAWWQNNPLTSIPTQFLQVQAKLVENTVGGLLGNGKWTRKEAAAAMMGQLALYGTAGVPIASEVSAYLKESSQGSELGFAQENPIANEAMDQGFMGIMFNSLGMDNDFSSPGSIIAGLDDNFVMDLVKNAGELAKGESREISFSAPSVGVAQRGTDAVMTFYNSIMDIATAPTMETVGDSALKTIDSISAITSTWSNARKVLFLERMGGLTNSRGNISISMENLEGVSFQSLLAKAMGIPLDIENAYYELKSFNYDSKKAVQESTKALKEVYNEFRLYDNKELFEAKKAVILSEYENQPLVRQQLINSMLRSVTEGRSVKDRDLKTFTTNYIRSNGKVGAPAFLNTLTNPEPEQE